MASNNVRPANGRGLAGTEEVIAWELPTGYTTTRAVLAAALEQEGFDGGEAGPLATRYAFTRLIRQMAKDRLVRLFQQETSFVTFQLTTEYRTADWLRYDPDAKYTLSLDSGEVAGTDEQVAEWIQSRLQATAEERRNADVNRMLQRLCDREARLLSVKTMSGVYLALPRNRQFLDRLGRLVRSIGGILRRWPVDHRSPVASATTAEVVSSAAAAAEENDELLPLAEQDDWPERVLAQQLELVRRVQRDISETQERLIQHAERLELHRQWLEQLQTAAHAARALDCGPVSSE